MRLFFMMEYEVKAKLSKEEVIDFKNKIVVLGAKYQHEERTDDVYFDTPDKELLINDKSLRIRQEWTDELRYYVSYKGPKIDKVTKSREERLYRMDSPYASLKTLVEFYKDLGFEVIAKVTKTRIVFVFGNIVICLDEVENLGYFVELEYNTNKVNAKGDVDIPSLLLGFAEMMKLTNQERRSYLELILELNE